MDHHGDDDVFGFDSEAEPVEPAGDAAAHRRRRLIAAAVGAAVTICLAVLVVPGGGDPTPTAADAPAATSPSAATTAPVATSVAAPSKPVPAPPAPTVPADVLAAEQADLADTATLIDSPVSLHSPAAWDRWLPEGKPYPGASTEEDIATCPRLAARLGGALGVELSYWTGTLPQGPVGCTWVPTPLSYDGPYDYAYVLSVGYLADGTTTEDWRHHFYEHQGAVCPDVPVPAAGPGAVLIRCSNDATGYTLVVPDARRAGVWFLQAETRAHAGHPASSALVTLVDAVRDVYA
jgi:hypothetical protein